MAVRVVVEAMAAKAGAITAVARAAEAWVARCDSDRLSDRGEGLGLHDRGGGGGVGFRGWLKRTHCGRAWKPLHVVLTNTGASGGGGDDGEARVS